MQDDIVADHIGEQRQQGILKAFSKAVHHYGLWNATHLWADFTANLHGKNRQFTAVLYWAQEAVSPPCLSPSLSDPAQLFPLSTDHNREPSLTLNLCFCITGPLVFFFWAAGPLCLSLLLSLQSKCFIALYRQIQLYSFYLSLHAYIYKTLALNEAQIIGHFLLVVFAQASITFINAHT